MAVVTKYDSIALAGYFDPASQPGAKGDASMGAKVHAAVGTVEAASGDSATSKYYLARIPSNARIMGQSVLHYDALGTGAKVELGIAGVNGNLTGDVDTLMAAADVSSAGSANVPGDIANYGEYAWKLAGETSDPGGEVDIVAQVTVAIAAAGTITLELFYLVP